MKLVPIKSLFHIEYGNQYDLNKLSPCSEIESRIAFVSRTSKNNGIATWIEPVADIEPYPAGLLTVTLGGTYLLSSFVQQQPFYTAQNIKVLTPKTEMTTIEKLIICSFIKHNRFRYTSHGREVNKTFDELFIPALDETKSIAKKLSIPTQLSNKSGTTKEVKLNHREWRYFQIGQLFDILGGKRLVKAKRSDGSLPLIVAKGENNGIGAWIDAVDDRLQYSNKVTIDMFFHAFYQKETYDSDDNVYTLSFKKTEYRANENPLIWLFITTILNHHGFKYAYGRQLRLKRLLSESILLPINSNGNPDWQFMEDYIKSLPYSSNLE